jgi:phage terminase Nu1 subunit (DNA packaging protein)
MALMNQTEYARHKGVSKMTISNAIKTGRISLVDGKIDPDSADKQWAQRTRARARTLADGGKPTAPPADPTRGEPDYFIERARRERAEADIAEVKAAEQCKKLVMAEDVKREWQSISGRIREAFLQMPDRLSPVLEMRPLAFIRKTLDDELRAALEELATDP